MKNNYREIIKKQKLVWNINNLRGNLAHPLISIASGNSWDWCRANSYNQNNSPQCAITWQQHISDKKCSGSRCPQTKNTIMPWPTQMKMNSADLSNIIMWHKITQLIIITQLYLFNGCSLLDQTSLANHDKCISEMQIVNLFWSKHMKPSFTIVFQAEKETLTHSLIPEYDFCITFILQHFQFSRHSFDDKINVVPRGEVADGPRQKW